MGSGEAVVSACSRRYAAIVHISIQAGSRAEGFLIDKKLLSHLKEQRQLLADRVRFELTEPLQVRRFSRPLP